VVSTITGTIVDTAGTEVISLLGRVATVALLVFLVVRELAAASENPRLQSLSRHPYVPIAPLLFVFCLILVAGIL
jgi:ABC-type anion transport system duplicated permease subunit